MNWTHPQCCCVVPVQKSATGARPMELQGCFLPAADEATLVSSEASSLPIRGLAIGPGGRAARGAALQGLRGRRAPGAGRGRGTRAADQGWPRAVRSGQPASAMHLVPQPQDGARDGKGQRGPQGAVSLRDGAGGSPRWRSRHRGPRRVPQGPSQQGEGGRISGAGRPEIAPVHEFFRVQGDAAEVQDQPERAAPHRSPGRAAGVHVRHGPGGLALRHHECA